MPTVADIAAAIEAFAPLSLQEKWDNCGLQVGSPQRPVTAVLTCLDVNEEILDEAARRDCNMIVTHHPLLFRGLKHLTGATTVERIVEQALARGIAIYSAHTNIDNAPGGMSHEMARMLRLKNIRVLSPQTPDSPAGLGVVGEIDPMPALGFLRKLKETFHVAALRYSATSPQLVVRRVALCGGAGADFIDRAISAGADVYVSGDLKYHEIISAAEHILIADIGHYDSEACVRKIFAGIIKQKYPDLCIYLSESDKNPVAVM